MGAVAAVGAFSSKIGEKIFRTGKVFLIVENQHCGCLFVDGIGEKMKNLLQKVAKIFGG